MHGGRWDGLQVDEVVDFEAVAFNLIAHRNGVIEIKSKQPPAEVAAMLRQIADELEGPQGPSAAVGSL